MAFIIILLKKLKKLELSPQNFHSGSLLSLHLDFHILPYQVARDATKQLDFKSVSRSYSLYENKALKLKLKWEKT